MNPDDAPALRCGVDEQQLIAYLDGELTGQSRERMATQVAECDCCQAFAADIALASKALGTLPELRCPDHVAAAAEEAARLSPAAPTRHRSVARFATAAALAASLAAIALWPAEPTPRLTETEQQKLVAVQRVVGSRATAAGAHALDRGVVQPTRQVIAKISDGPLGRWSARAAGLLATSDEQVVDPT